MKLPVMRRSPAWRRALTACAIPGAIAIGMAAQFLVFRNQTYSLLGPDFIDYSFQSEEILAGHLPSVLVKPGGCALWILIHRSLFGPHVAGYRDFCIAAIGLLPLFAALIGFYFCGWLGAIVAAGMTIVSPVSLYVSLLAETPATCFLAAALVAALYSGRAPNAASRYGLAVLAALLAFLSYQSRPDYLMYLIAIAAILAVETSAEKTRIASRKLLVAGGIWAVLLAALAWVNAPEYGSYGPVRYDVYLRYYTVFQDMNLQPSANESSVQIIRSSLIKAGVRPAGLSGQDYLGFPRAWFVVRAALKESGLTWAQADRTMNAAAISAIEANPGVYLNKVASTFSNFLLFRPVFGTAQPATRPPAIEVPPAVYARLHDLQFKSDSAGFRLAEKTYEELKATAPERPSMLPKLRALESKLGFLTIYPGIVLALALRSRRQRWMIGAATGSVFLVFLAYATGGFFQDRYLAGHCFLLSSLAAIGYSSLVQKIFTGKDASAGAMSPAGAGGDGGSPGQQAVAIESAAIEEAQ